MIQRTRSKMDSQREVLKGFAADVGALKRGRGASPGTPDSQDSPWARRSITAAPRSPKAALERGGGLPGGGTAVVALPGGGGPSRSVAALARSASGPALACVPRPRTPVAPAVARPGSDASGACSASSTIVPRRPVAAARGCGAAVARSPADLLRQQLPPPRELPTPLRRAGAAAAGGGRVEASAADSERGRGKRLSSTGPVGAMAPATAAAHGAAAAAAHGAAPTAATAVHDEGLPHRDRARRSPTPTWPLGKAGVMKAGYRSHAMRALRQQRATRPPREGCARARVLIEDDET